MTAPLTVLSAGCDDPPTCWKAHSRQAASSTWNWSNVFPLPGKLMMLGPVGTEAQPLETATTSSSVAAPTARGLMASAPEP
jgi:hypothetical protein